LHLPSWRYTDTRSNLGHDPAVAEIEFLESHRIPVPVVQRLGHHRAPSHPDPVASTA
jgi:hypothetical protein